jgi:hypothetical protein
VTRIGELFGTAFTCLKLYYGAVKLRVTHEYLAPTYALRVCTAGAGSGLGLGWIWAGSGLPDTEPV